MATLLIRDAAHVETFDDDDCSFKDASIFVRDGAIEAIGPAASLPREADRVVDASGCIVIPGLVNTHHHFYQTLTRAVPGTQDVELFDWLVTLYPIWARLTPAALRSSTAVACAELLLSGCTTASDHTYLWPNGCQVDDEVAVAKEIGLRFHASRGSMSVGESKGGLPPDSVVEDEAVILADTQRAIETLHDPNRFAMTRIVVAPCSPFSVSPDLMR
jgi:8-oxoguanine deaminase